MKVIVIGAHPDDYEVGAAMRLMHHVRMKDDVTGVICSYGEKAGSIETRIREAVTAAEFIGMTDLHILPFPDTHFPATEEIKDALEEIIFRLHPDLVYTHYLYDRHQDHRNVATATSIACRKVQNILTYHSPSTDLASFQPHLFHVGSIDDFKQKQNLMKIYRSQTKRKDGICLKNLRLESLFYGSMLNRYSHKPVYAEPFCANHFILNCRELP
jgi:LmbE family N-acetylglucosaminyl deacetylase